jgi:VanZ family protein
VTAAILVSLAIVLSSPYVGQLRGIVQAALPGQYRLILITLVAVALAGAAVIAIRRIRDRRLLRYLALAAAVGIGAGYARMASTGNVDVDLVEQVHFVEYGLLTYLFYRVWQRRNDAASVLLPLCAVTLVGIADELFQWLVPARVGELHDVLINAVAGVCGILFSLGVNPPPALDAPLGWQTRRQMAAAILAVAIAGATFVDLVHFGRDVAVVRQEPDPAYAVTFRSHFSPDTLQALAAERVEAWRTQPPMVIQGIAVEDRYLSEGQWHVQHRNEAFGDGETWTAWNENLILESFYAPVLDLGHRWSAEQRAQAAAAAGGDRRPYVSEAHPYPIFAIDRWRFRLTALTIVAAAWLLFLRRAPAIVHEASV